MPRNTRNVLTTVAVRNLVRAGKPVARSDGGGLTLTVSSSGHASWVLRYRYAGKQREYTIGPEADFPLAQARQEAEELRRRITGGEDIAAAKRREQALRSTPDLPDSFSALAHLWFTRTQQSRLKHPQVVWRTFTKWINPRIGSLPLDDLRGFHIAECLEEIKAGGAPTVANDARRHIRKVLDYGVSLGLLHSNPATSLSHLQVGVTERARERTLTLEEVCSLLRSMADNRDWFGRDNELAIRLLLILGVRKQELTQARWSEFTLGAPKWQIPRERSKTGRGIIIPLPALAVEHLRELQVRAAGSEWVLPARRRGRRRLGHIGPDTLNRALDNLDHGIADFVVHDLRRTMRTNLSALGVRPEVAERCLNHKLRGVLGVYDQHDFLRERRLALEKWAEVIRTLDSHGLDAARQPYSLSKVVAFQTS